MKSRSTARAPSPARAALLETLETRVLFSASSLLHPLALLPNESEGSTPAFSNLWHLHNTGQDGGAAGADIHVSDVWDLTTGSNDVIVAVLDTGIDLDHPDLVDNIWTNPNEIPGDGIDNDNNGFIDDVHGWNFIDGNNNVNDTSLTGHGTLVSGVLGAVGDNGLGISGVAQRVTILPVKIGTDLGVSSSDVAAAINYVIKLKKSGLNIVAINASYLGFSGFGGSELSAIASAGSNGILYVSAAGNNSLNLDFLGYSFVKKSNQLVVAATDRDDHLWSDSNYGGSSVEIAAPGADITSTWNKLTGYLTSSGTSFAGPMVSGAIALLKSYVPGATASQIRSALMQGVDHLPSLQGKVMSNGRLNIMNSLQILINQTRFSGAVESADISTITGWAYDSQLGEDAVPIKLVIDGVEQPLELANIDRPDLASKLPSISHGFSIELPALGPGNHTIQVFATGDNGAEKLLGGKTVVGKAPTGKLEIATSSLLQGFASDADSPLTPVQIRVDIDGDAFATTTANLLNGGKLRGFSVPLTGLAVGFHRADVYMLDAQTGEPKLLASKTLMVNSAPQAVIETFSALGISGYAWDPDAGEDPVQLRIDIDKLPPILITAETERLDIVGAVGSAHHGFSYTLPMLMPGAHTVKLYIVDAQSGRLTLLQTQKLKYANTAENTMPVAKVEKLTATLTGNTYDKNNPNASLLVRLDIDGVTGTPVPADILRSNMLKLGGGLHGFSFDLSSLSPGPHRLDLYTYDDASGTPVLFYSKMIGNAAPTGKVTTFLSTAVGGWAFSPALASDPALIRIDIDNIPGFLTPAGETNLALIATLGSAGHGFTETFPTLSAGNHKITIYVLDPLTLNVKQLASKSFKFV